MTKTKSEYPAPDPTEIDQIRSATESGKRITLDKKDLRNLGDELAKLRSPRLHHCDIRGMTFTGTRKQPVPWSEGQVTGCDIDGASFTHVKLDNTNITLRKPRQEDATLTFRKCDLRGARIELTGPQLLTEFHGCDLHKAVLVKPHGEYRVHFVWTKGLWDTDGADYTNLGSQEMVRFHHWIDFPTWERLRRVGATRLMSVSWVALIGLVIYANAMRWYNDQIKSIHSQVTNSEAASWVDQLGPLPVPEQFGMLMLSILCIALAATILLWRCPPLVLHHTRHQWNLLSGKHDLEYQGASYDCWRWRWACALGYGLGGYAAVYLAVRVFNSVAFFFDWLGE